MAKKTKPHTATPKRNRRLIYTVVAATIVLIPAAYFYSVSLTQPSEAKAAIIDQLSSSKLGDAIRKENQTFLESAKGLLYKRFSVIDYYSDNATVEKYRQLASAGYKLILWRAHSAIDFNSMYVAISTTDKYLSVDYDQYLEDKELTLCNITGDQNLYFGITPKFIQQVMTGTFQDTVIVLMSCNGLKQGYLKTAQAFEAKGVKVLISWDDWVSSSDNDYGTSVLLQHLIDDNDTVGAAVGKMWAFPSEFGWTILQYDPHSSEASGYRIPDYRERGDTNGAVVTLPSVRKVEEMLGD